MKPTLAELNAEVEACAALRATVATDPTAAPVTWAEIAPLAVNVIRSAAADPRLTDAALREVATFGPTPLTGMATDWDQAHLATTLLKVRRSETVAAADVQRAHATLGALGA